MAARVSELAALPVDAVLHGELGEDGWPYFPLVCQRLLNGDDRIPHVYVVLDVRELEGQSTMHQPLKNKEYWRYELEREPPGWR